MKYKIYNYFSLKPILITIGLFLIPVIVSVPMVAVSLTNMDETLKRYSTNSVYLVGAIFFLVFFLLYGAFAKSYRKKTKDYSVKIPFEDQNKRMMFTSPVIVATILTFILGIVEEIILFYLF